MRSEIWVKKAFGQKSEWEFCPEAFLINIRRQLCGPLFFTCFQVFATSGCADVQSVLWHATAAPAIVNPADNRKEMFIKVSEPVHPGLHLPSAACGVKKWLSYFLFLFLSGRPSLCVILYLWAVSYTHLDVYKRQRFLLCRQMKACVTVWSRTASDKGGKKE